MYRPNHGNKRNCQNKLKQPEEPSLDKRVRDYQFKLNKLNVENKKREDLVPIESEILRKNICYLFAGRERPENPEKLIEIFINLG